jgi:hypothetical protein
MSQTYTDDCFTLAGNARTQLQAFEDNFAALKSSFSGASQPANTVAGMWWYDTTAHILKVRNEANSAWLSVWDLANNKPVITNLSNEITGAMIAAAVKDPVAGTAGLRTLGTGAQQACPGNDARFGAVSDGAVTGPKLLASTAAGLEVYFAKGPTERSTGSTSYAKVKELDPLTRGGAVHIVFTLRSTEGVVYGKLYKNGVAIGTERQVNGTSESFGETFTTVVGDVWQVYAKTFYAGNTAFVKDLTITVNDPYVVREVSGF